MTRGRWLRALVGATIIWAAGCVGSEHGNGATPPVHAKLAFQLANAAGGGGATTVSAMDSDGVPFIIERARLSVDRIDLWPVEGALCSDGFPDVAAATAGEALGRTPYCTTEDDKLRIDGPWVVDLVTGEAVPSLAAVTIPTVSYRRVDARVRPADAADGLVADDDPLAGASLVASGRVALGGGDADFLLVVDMFDHLRFDAADPAGITPELRSLVMRLDPGRWLSELPLAACAADGDLPRTDDGVLLIAAGRGRCGGVKQAVQRAIREAGRLASRP